MRSILEPLLVSRNLYPNSGNMLSRIRSDKEYNLFFLTYSLISLIFSINLSSF